MSIIKPFRALRPVYEKAKQISCVPYDVIYESEVREFINQNPLTFLRVTRPEADFAADETPTNEEIFARARENLQRFIDEELFALEDEPCVYVYRLSNEKHSQTGVVACCSLDEYEGGKIRKHEKTRPDKVEDRTEHMLAVKAQSGLIFLAFRGTENTKRLIYEATLTKPIYSFHCSDGVKQTVWQAARTEEFVEAFEEVPSLYIADGHHRIESANLARKILSEENPHHTGAENYNFVVAGMFPAEDLRILAYNRVVKDLNNLSEEEFFKRAKENFTITETEKKVPESPASFCMYMNGKWFYLTSKSELSGNSNPIENLDASILQNFLLEPVLGIDDPRTNKRVGFVGGARGTAELEKFVDDGTAKLAFSLFPTSMNELFAVSDINEIMPPKSTWFEPKLRDGLLVHLI